MRVDSIFRNANITSKDISVKDSDIPSGVKLANKDNRQASQSYEQKQVNETELIEAVDKANKVFLGIERRCEISVHKETNTIMVKVIDNQTDEIIREVPPEKILNMVARMWEIAGIIVDRRI